MLKKRSWRNRLGQGLTEYALLIALVSLGLILLLGRYRNSLGNSLKNSATCMNATVPITQEPVAGGGGASTACTTGGTGGTGGTNGNGNNGNGNGNGNNNGNNGNGNGNGNNTNGFFIFGTFIFF
jgi:Flp pilus assembly pilin Flp